MKGKKDKSIEKDVKSALVKKALGYDAEEIVEEYVGDADGVKLAKRKVTIKNYPPDLTAIKLLWAENVTPVENMTDDELLKEKKRLLELLKAENKE